MQRAAVHDGGTRVTQRRARKRQAADAGLGETEVRLVRTQAPEVTLIGAARRLVDSEDGYGRVAAHDGAGPAELAHCLVSGAATGAERKPGVGRHRQGARTDGARSAERKRARADDSPARERAGRAERERARPGFREGTDPSAERIGEGDVVSVGVEGSAARPKDHRTRRNVVSRAGRPAQAAAVEVQAARSPEIAEGVRFDQALVEERASRVSVAGEAVED